MTNRSTFANNVLQGCLSFVDFLGNISVGFYFLLERRYPCGQRLDLLRPLEHDPPDRPHHLAFAVSDGMPGNNTLLTVHFLQLPDLGHICFYNMMQTGVLDDIRNTLISPFLIFKSEKTLMHWWQEHQLALSVRHHHSIKRISQDMLKNIKGKINAHEKTQGIFTMKVEKIDHPTALICLRLHGRCNRHISLIGKLDQHYPFTFQLLKPMPVD